MFYHTNDAVESKMARVGAKVRGFGQAVAGYVRAVFALARLGPQCDGGSHGLRSTV